MSTVVLVHLMIAFLLLARYVPNVAKKSV